MNWQNENTIQGMVSSWENMTIYPLKKSRQELRINVANVKK
jgi:hypothetical protein